MNVSAQNPILGYTLMYAHAQDEDCIVDEDSKLCVGCGKSHWIACERCGGRAYHKPACRVRIAEYIGEPQPSKRADWIAEMIVLFFCLALFGGGLLASHEGWFR